MRELAAKSITTNSFLPERSALSGSIALFRNLYSFGELVRTMSKLALVSVRAEAHLREIFAHFSLIFADVRFDNPMRGPFLAGFVISGFGLAQLGNLVVDGVIQLEAHPFDNNYRMDSSKEFKYYAAFELY